jgi:ABC-type Zn uptake system ZnuABC Zn-binding protein ZnuA
LGPGGAVTAPVLRIVLNNIPRVCRFGSIALALLALVVAACGDGSPARDSELVVVATTTLVGDLAHNVGGRRIAVRTLATPSADPHDYEPKPSDVRSITDADIVLKSGGELDHWLDDVIENAGGDADTVNLIDFVKTIGDEDPHWWHDPHNTVLAVREIERALVAADPDGRGAYTRNAEGYEARLRELDSEITACIRMVPLPRRKLVTTHDALGYFASRYGIEVVGAVIPSLSTQAQASAHDVQELVDRIRDEGVEAIFPERTLSPRLEGAIAREAGVQVGDPLWADALGPRGSNGETYLEAMASNTESMVTGMTAGQVSCRPDP